MPFASINANFNPAKIAGYAFGILTFINICHLVKPNPCENSIVYDNQYLDNKLCCEQFFADGQWSTHRRWLVNKDIDVSVRELSNHRLEGIEISAAYNYNE